MSILSPKFTAASPADYAAWLKLHLQQDGTITHFYDYPFPSDTFLTATRPFVLGGECGSEARHILVPDGVTWSAGGGMGMGHNTVYLADGTMKGHWVPVYTSDVFHGLPGYDEGMAASRRKSAKFWAEHERQANRGPYSDLTRYAKGDHSDVEQTPLSAPATGTNVFVEDGRVCLIPSSMPQRMTSDEALALAENLRAAALGASSHQGNAT